MVEVPTIHARIRALDYRDRKEDYNMKTISPCRSTEAMVERIMEINLLALILARRSGKLWERIVVGEEVYNPYTEQSLGGHTKELEGIQNMLYTLGKYGESL